mmetsp:Transcript_33305/g.98904  ORF Transcript_33305/g.98904 Transcript_33305/m.98904 type:complete len:324 (+) Transcript_33305:738-1709(+)
MAARRSTMACESASVAPPELVAVMPSNTALIGALTVVCISALMVSFVPSVSFLIVIRSRKFAFRDLFAGLMQLSRRPMMLSPDSPVMLSSSAGAMSLTICPSTSSMIRQMDARGMDTPERMPPRMKQKMAKMKERDHAQQAMRWGPLLGFPELVLSLTTHHPVLQKPQKVTKKAPMKTRDTANGRSSFTGASGSLSGWTKAPMLLMKDFLSSSIGCALWRIVFRSSARFVGVSWSFTSLRAFARACPMPLESPEEADVSRSPRVVQYSHLRYVDVYPVWVVDWTLVAVELSTPLMVSSADVAISTASLTIFVSARVASRDNMN